MREKSLVEVPVIKWLSGHDTPPPLSPAESLATLPPLSSSFQCATSPNESADADAQMIQAAAATAVTSLVRTVSISVLPVL